ncbi:MAG: hypothetical protein ABW123_13395 [Cystobacter sp.]
MWAVAVLGWMGVGCQQEQKAATPSRAEIRTVGNSTVEFIPKDAQHPYCLLYTVSEKGVIRQLTMTRENRSIRCESGKRIYNSAFRIPVEEGKIRAYVFFSDQRIQAGSVAQQLYDLRDKPKVTAMDFRLPGSVTVAQLEYTPQPGGEAVPDAVVGTTDLAETSDAPPLEEEEPGLQLQSPEDGGAARPTP